MHVDQSMLNIPCQFWKIFHEILPALQVGFCRLEKIMWAHEPRDVESLYGNWLSISIQSWPKVSIIPHKSYIWYPIQTRVPDGFLVMLMLMGFYYLYLT